MIYTMHTYEKASVIIQVMLFQGEPIFLRRSIFGTKISQDNEAVEAQELSGLLSLEQFGDCRENKGICDSGFEKKKMRQCCGSACYGPSVCHGGTLACSSMKYIIPYLPFRGKRICLTEMYLLKTNFN